MAQIANGLANEERAYSLKTQSGYDGSDDEWHGKSGYNGSDRKWCGKWRKDILTENGERVRWVRS